MQELYRDLVLNCPLSFLIRAHYIGSMQQDTPFNSLAGMLLIAMPNMMDPRFHRSVLFVCAHDPNGAMALMLNQPSYGMDIYDLFEQLDIKKTTLSDRTPNTEDDEDDPLSEVAVLNGGPVETGRGFVLHGPDFQQKETVLINDQFSVTATVDILQAIAKGEGPHDFSLMLGYAGWQAGQLEREMLDNTWLTVPATPELVFHTPSADQWDVAISTLGIHPAQLTAFSGRA